MHSTFTLYGIYLKFPPDVAWKNSIIFDRKREQKRPVFLYRHEFWKVFSVVKFSIEISIELHKEFWECH